MRPRQRRAVRQRREARQAEGRGRRGPMRPRRRRQMQRRQAQRQGPPPPQRDPNYQRVSPGVYRRSDGQMTDQNWNPMPGQAGPGVANQVGQMMGNYNPWAPAGPPQGGMGDYWGQLRDRYQNWNRGNMDPGYGASPQDMNRFMQGGGFNRGNDAIMPGGQYQPQPMQRPMPGSNMQSMWQGSVGRPMARPMARRVGQAVGLMSKPPVDAY